MKTVELITFKGCQPTIDFRTGLEELLAKEGLEIDLKMTMVPSPAQAEQMGLAGSPTIVIEGKELQREEKGPFGFY